MKLIISLGLLVTVVLARPQRPPQQHGNLNDIPIVKYDFDGPNPDGSYQFSYETGNGIAAQEKGYQAAPDSQVAEGSFSYTGDDGQHYAIQYVADGEGGFRPQGAHIPTPPPIPEAIQKALEYNAAHPEEDGGEGPVRRPPGGGFGRK